jgi:hypothetical protein
MVVLCRYAAAVTSSNTSARGRSHVALAAWYCAAVVVVAGVAALFEPSPVGGVDGRVGVCVPASRCVDPTPRIFAEGSLLLAATLVIALPLCAYLRRKWEMPVLAGSMAALTAWWVSGLLYCVGGLWLAR